MSESGPRLRSQLWFHDPGDPDSTAIHIERYMNFGITREELQSGSPIIGIAQSGSDLSPCNRVHLRLAERVQAGVRAAGGVPLEFPVHPIQETGKRPTAALDRNLAYLGLVEVLHGYPLDGVVLTTGCDKTTPSQLMAAATVNLPAIVLSGGPMLDGWYRGRLTGSGTILWEARKLYAAARSTTRVHRDGGVVGEVRRALQHDGHRVDHELARRGARDVPSGVRGDPPLRTGSEARSPTRRAAHRRSRPAGHHPVEDHDPRGVRETSSSRTPRSEARPTPRSTSTPSPGTSASPSPSKTGSGSGIASPCSSTCSRPATISARATSGRAGCRRSWGRC